MKTIWILIAMLFLSTASLPAIADEAQGCRASIMASDEARNANIPRLDQLANTIGVCEEELLPFFNDRVNAMYRQMKTFCVNNWGVPKGVPMPSENRLGMMLCQLNAVRYMDSLNLGD